MIPLPHLVTHIRQTKTHSADGIEVAGAPKTIESHVKAQINPASTNVDRLGLGNAESAFDLIYLDALDGNGNLRKVHYMDTFVNEATDEIWVALQPGVPAENPSYFGTGTTVWDHIEVRVAQKYPETEILP